MRRTTFASSSAASAAPVGSTGGDMPVMLMAPDSAA
jgi:hypothetical protein